MAPLGFFTVFGGAGDRCPRVWNWRPIPFFGDHAGANGRPVEIRGGGHSEGTRTPFECSSTPVSNISPAVLSDSPIIFS